MQRAEAEETIPAPPAEVFAFLADPANLPSWQTGVLSAERTSAGPVGRGSTARIVRELLGQRIAADLSMTAYEPDRLLELESTVSGVHAVATLELAPAAKLMANRTRVAARAAEQDLATSLERLRGHFAAHLEGG